MEAGGATFTEVKPSTASSDDAKIIHDRLAETALYWDIKRAVKEEIIKPKYKADDLATVIPQVIERLGLVGQLQNAVYSQYHQLAGQAAFPPQQPTLPLPVLPKGETLEFVANAKLKWESRVKEELEAIAREQGKPHARDRMEGEEEAEEEDYTVRFLFDENDFLDLLAKISNPNNSMPVTKIVQWGMIKVLLKTPTTKLLRQRFSGLDPKHRQNGLDDELQSWFAAERLRVAKKVVAMASVPVARQLLKRGCPNALRAQMWLIALDIKEPQLQPDYDRLMDEVDRVELLIDDLVHLDVQSTALDANFFPFEDSLDSCLMAFTRDRMIYTSRVTFVENAAGPVSRTPFPPCGVVPFRGLVFYAAPLCFLLNETEKIYGCFKAMYCRYFCRLHHISSDSRDIIGLAKMFEDLLQAHDPALFFHLIQIQVQPLRIAFNWIFYAFCGYLEIDQVLCVWDRIIGHDTLDILPLVATAIFLFRSAALMEAENEDAVHNIFEDASRIKVVPLLQKFLFLRDPVN